MGFGEGVAELDVKLVVVDVVQEHIHPRQVVGGVVDFLPEEAVLDDVGVEVFLGLEQQGAGTGSRVVDLVDARLLVHGQLGYETGNMLRREELATGFTGIGGIVGDEEFVGISKEVDFAVLEIAEIEATHAGEHGSEAEVFVFDGISQAITGRVEVRKQSLDVWLRGVAVGGTLNGRKDGGEVGIQALVGVRRGEDLGKELAREDEVALGLDGIVLNLWRDDAVVQLRVVDVWITGLDVGGKVFADKAVEKGAENILLEVPAIDRSADIVCYLPDLPLEGGALLVACCHGLILRTGASITCTHK